MAAASVVLVAAVGWAAHQQSHRLVEKQLEAFANQAQDALFARSEDAWSPEDLRSRAGRLAAELDLELLEMRTEVGPDTSGQIRAATSNERGEGERPGALAIAALNQQLTRREAGATTGRVRRVDAFMVCRGRVGWVAVARRIHVFGTKEM